MTVAYMFDNIIRRTIVATIFLLLSFSVAAQVTITGYVYDENREPIIGAVISEKNGSATMTDVKGWFKIEVSDKNPLRVDFIGYKSLTIYTEEKDMFIDAVLSASEVESDYVDIDLDIYQKAQKGDIDAMSEVGDNYYWGGRNWDGYNGIACDWLLPAAKSGDYLSQYRLYQLFYVGKGVKKDIKVALQWLNKAANQNYTTAIFELGLWYYEEEDGGPKRDYKKAFELFTKAAEQGDFRAWIKKGDCYYDGNGTDKSYANATECWLTAIEYAWLAPKEIWDIISEHADAPLLFRIGENYYKGKTTFKQDFAKALEWFYKASDKGSIAAKKRIGDCFYYANGVKQDFKEAVKWYQLAAEKGNAEAQNNLGNCYDAGYGVTKDYTEAAKWYRKAAEKGNAEAQNNLGNCYYVGDGVTKDYTEAVKWFRKAAEQGHAMAQSNLGCCYYAGGGVTKDYNEAVKWFRKAAEQGNEWGLFCLGECYFDGYGVTKNYTEAVKWYRKAAEQGNASAQNNLGYCYYNGHGVTKDYNEAVKWYRKAAEQGNLAGQFHLGECYYYGHGVTKDYTEAVKWFRKDAEQGTAKAQNQLGDCYYYGHGVTKDFKEAVKWYQLAAEQGNAEAQNNLGNCYNAGVGIKQDYTEAVKWYRKAAEQGHALAQSNLGCCYYAGDGVITDYTEAVKWFRKAAEQGNLAGQFFLGECYYYGRGVTKDYTEAVKWFHKAAEQGTAEAQDKLGDCYYYGHGVTKDFKEAVKWYQLAAEQGNADAQNALGHCYSMGEGVPYDMEEAVAWWTFAANQGNIEAKLALESLEKEREKGVNPPTSLPTLLTGVSSYSTEYVYEENNRRSEEELAEEIRKALESHLAPKTEAPQLRVLSDAKVTFSDTRQEVRFAISDDTQTIKYRIDGGATTTLPTQVVQAGVCEIELPQRDCLLTMWCVGGEPHTIQYIYDSVSSARKSATLHILAIGLNDYQDPNLGNLSYAEKDARDVISTIQKKHKHTFANIDAQLLVGRDVTSEMITEKINNLADKASASDLAVIFFAGHGLVDERDRYYLSTYNITNASTPRRGGYSASQFVEDISYINCKLLVFIDACYSGKLLEGYRGTVSSENFFREMNNTPNGTCIYTSSNKDVKSKESAKFKHGVFTQALIESFEFENSDIDGDNRISVIEVRNYLEKRIPQLTQNKQKPIYRNVEEIDFPLFIK